MTEAYDGREVVGMDLHRRRSVLVRMTGDGRKLETARITNSPAELRRQIARAGKSPRVVLEATYGWYWAADTLAAAGAKVHLAHPLGVKGFAYRRVKNDERDAAGLADLLMGRLPEAWIAPHRVRELRELTRYRTSWSGSAPAARTRSTPSWPSPPWVGVLSPETGKTSTIARSAPRPRPRASISRLRPADISAAAPSAAGLPGRGWSAA